MSLEFNRWLRFDGRTTKGCVTVNNCYNVYWQNWKQHKIWLIYDVKGYVHTLYTCSSTVKRKKKAIQCDDVQYFKLVT